MAAKDAIDIWKEMRDYIVSRLKQRYNTIDEAKQDCNQLFEYGMATIQDNYDRFFNKEIFKNLDVYNIEILGEGTDELMSDENMINEKEDNENDMFESDEDKVSDEEINNEFGNELD